MSRLRRLVLWDRFCFVSCRVLPRRALLSEWEFACLAGVVHERREEPKFVLTAGVFLPDHGQAIFYPPYPLAISRVMESIKDGATQRIHRRRRECGTLFQARFFDRALRTVREYHEKVEYIHQNPVKAGYVERPGDWPWSSVHDYVGNMNDRPVTPSGLAVDRFTLPANPRTRI